MIKLFKHQKQTNKKHQEQGARGRGKPLKDSEIARPYSKFGRCID